MIRWKSSICNSQISDGNNFCFVSGVTCQQAISAQSKISLVDGQPCCVRCYEDKHAKRCSQCQKAIVADVEYLEFEDKYWHKECFNCSKCQVIGLI